MGDHTPQDGYPGLIANILTLEAIFLGTEITVMFSQSVGNQLLTPSSSSLTLSH